MSKRKKADNEIADNEEAGVNTKKDETDTKQGKKQGKKTTDKKEKEKESEDESEKETGDEKKTEKGEGGDGGGETEKARAEAERVEKARVEAEKSKSSSSSSSSSASSSSSSSSFPSFDGFSTPTSSRLNPPRSTNHSPLAKLSLGGSAKTKDKELTAVSTCAIAMHPSFADDLSIQIG